MGRIRNHDIKKISFEILERYGDKVTNDFNANKEVLDEIKVADSKKMRNKIAGYVTCIAKRRGS